MTNADFNGTSNAGSHIGDKRSNNLAAATDAATEVLKLELSVGAENADVIALSFIVKDRAGLLIREATRIHVRLFTSAMIEALVGAVTASENVGAFVSTDAQAAAIFDTTDQGIATIDVADVAGASGLTFYAIAEFLDREGASALATITFD